LVTGSKYNNVENKFETFLSKLDANGDTIWLRNYFNNYNGSNGKKIIEKSTNEYFVLSTLDTKNAFDNAQKINLMKTDSLGNELWSKTFRDSTLGLTAVDMTFDSDSNIVILGQLGYSGTFIKPGIKVIITDLQGVTINSFESYEIEYNCSGIFPRQIQIKNNNYFIIGTTNDNDNTKVDGFIYDFNKDGTLNNYEYFGGNDVEHFNSFCKTKDDGFAIVGRTYSFGSRENYGDIYFVKTDSDLKSTINTISKNKVDTTICQGDSLELFNKLYWENISYYDTINLNNYDSVIVVNLSYYPHPFFNLSNDTIISIDDSIVLKPHNINSYTSIVWNDSLFQDSLIVFGNTYGVGEYSFWCSITNEYGCTFKDTINITVSIPSNITHIELADIQVYPNPFHNYITIQNNQQRKKIDIRIVNIYGQIQYYAKDIYLLDKHTISLEQLKSGLYFLEINDKTKKTMKKIKIIK